MHDNDVAGSIGTFLEVEFAQVDVVAEIASRYEVALFDEDGASRHGSATRESAVDDAFVVAALLDARHGDGVSAAFPPRSAGWRPL